MFSWKLLKYRFCFQRAYIVLLLHNPAVLEKGTCVEYMCQVLEQKHFLQYSCSITYFTFENLHSAERVNWFLSLFPKLGDSGSLYFLFPKENDTLFKKQKFVNLQCPLWKCHYYVWCHMKPLGYSMRINFSPGHFNNEFKPALMLLHSSTSGLRPVGGSR